MKFDWSVEKIKKVYGVDIGVGDLKLVHYITMHTDWNGYGLNSYDYDDPINHRWNNKPENEIEATFAGRKITIPLYAWLASFEYHKKTLKDINEFRQEVKTILAKVKKNGGFSRELYATY